MSVRTTSLAAMAAFFAAITAPVLPADSASGQSMSIRPLTVAAPGGVSCRGKCRIKYEACFADCKMRYFEVDTRGVCKMACDAQKRVCYDKC